MKKMFAILAALSCAVSLAACGSSSGGSDEDITSGYVEENSIDLYDVVHWLTADMWNDGFCDISWYISQGTNSTGGELDINFTIDNLKLAYKKKDMYNTYIHSLDSSDEETAMMINAWDKMCEQMDLLYNKVTTETPRPKDTSYEYSTDLYNQYYDTFKKIAQSKY